MEIVVFILIAGLWAAFLLPSFFDHRRQTPSSATRDFARTRQLLASVAASQPDGEAYVRRHTQVRRTRVLVGLGVTAAVTLAIATVTGDIPWLWATIGVDAAIGVYVMVLLTIKQQKAIPRATVVAIAPAHPMIVEPEPQVEAYPESQTVRVIAG
jgi:hypothetical protein